MQEEDQLSDQHSCRARHPQRGGLPGRKTRRKHVVREQQGAEQQTECPAPVKRNLDCAHAANDDHAVAMLSTSRSGQVPGALYMTSGGGVGMGSDWLNMNVAPAMTAATTNTINMLIMKPLVT